MALLNAVSAPSPNGRGRFGESMLLKRSVPATKSSSARMEYLTNGAGALRTNWAAIWIHEDREG